MKCCARSLAPWGRRLSLRGAEGYQEDEKFAAQGIGLRYQNFVHPVYPQKNQDSFAPGLSIIDILMNQGFEWVKSWLNKD